MIFCFLYNSGASYRNVARYWILDTGFLIKHPLSGIQNRSFSIVLFRWGNLNFLRL